MVETDRDPVWGPGPLQVLCLDGGGLKGLFSAAVLEQLEGDLGVRLVEHFDLIAGTSTGGLIALALGGVPVRNVLPGAEWAHVDHPLA